MDCSSSSEGSNPKCTTVGNQRPLILASDLTESPVAVRLPPEVLAHIFSYLKASYKNPYEWLDVSLVCHEWYLATVSFASLWTHIKLPDIDSEAFLGRLLKLSGGALLTVEIGSSYPKSWYRAPPGKIEYLFEMVFRQLFRTQSLVLDCCDLSNMLHSFLDTHDYGEDRELVGEIRKLHVEMQRIWTTHGRDLILPLDQRVAPALETLVVGDGLGVPLENIASLSTLRSLSLSHTGSPESLVVRLHDCLQSLPVLRSFSLSYKDSQRTSSSPAMLARLERLPMIHLKSIKTFSLFIHSRTVSSAFMSRLRLPADADLYIDSRSRSMSSQSELNEDMKPVVSRFLPSCSPLPLQALYFSFSDGDSATLTGWWGNTSAHANCSDKSGRSFSIRIHRPDAYIFSLKTMVSTLPIDQIRLLAVDGRRPRGRPVCQCSADLGSLAPCVTELRLQQEEYPQYDIGYLCKLMRIGAVITLPFPQLDTLRLRVRNMGIQEAEHLRRVLVCRTGQGCAELRRLELVNVKSTEECLSALRAFIPEVACSTVEDSTLL